ncbi:leucine zipper domain-containing protein [Streptomyces sp. NBC_00659]|nr:leucine zipper domain-containing protein [Streptomyces sp. NBC_00659]
MGVAHPRERETRVHRPGYRRSHHRHHRCRHAAAPPVTHARHLYAISDDIRRLRTGHSAVLVELSVAARVAVTQVAARYAVSRQSMHSWVRKYEQSGLAGAAASSASVSVAQPPSCSRTGSPSTSRPPDVTYDGSGPHRSGPTPCQSMTGDSITSAGSISSPTRRRNSTRSRTEYASPRISPSTRTRRPPVGDGGETTTRNPGMSS